MNALPHRIGATFVLLMLISACASPNLPPTPVPPETVGVFTPDDLRARVDSTPDSHKIVISDEVVAWFPDRVNSMANWIGIAFIYHLPTMSNIVFDYEGNVDFRNTRYHSDEAQEQLEAVLADEGLMQQICERMAELNEGL